MTSPFQTHPNGRRLVVAALVVPAASSANNDKVDGVRAEIKRGTLEVKSGDQDNAVALRLKAGDPTRVQVDAGDDGTDDFSFARSDVIAINVKTGDGDDSVRIDDANGAFTNTIPTTIAGGDGDDTLQGGQVQVAAENETFRGGDGNDLGRRRQGQRHRPPRRRERHASAGITARAAT